MVQNPFCLDAAQTCPTPGSTHCWNRSLLGRGTTKTPEEQGNIPQPGIPSRGSCYPSPPAPDSAEQEGSAPLPPRAETPELITHPKPSPLNSSHIPGAEPPELIAHPLVLSP